MGVHIRDKKQEVTIGPKTFHFDLTKDVDKTLKCEIDLIIRHNEFLVEHTVKNEISRLLFKHKHKKNIQEHEMIFMKRYS